MKKVALALGSSEAGKELAEYLRANGYEIAGTATTGEEMIALLKRERPDAAVCDLLLPEGDGFEVLSAVRAEGLAVKTIMVSPMTNEDIIARAVTAGADYYVVKPFRPESLKRSLDGLFGEEIRKAEREYSRETVRTSNTLDERISNIFLTVGIPPHIKGYGYLREGVKMAVRNPEIINSITKELYPKIGERYATSASKVERAIRHAIEVAWNRGRIETINSLFGVRAYVGSEKPTNGEFIALVADKMLLEGGER